MLLTRQNTRDGRYAPAQPNPYLGDPIHLTAQTIVAPNSGANVAGIALRPPSHAAMILSAIKFQVQPSVVGGVTASLNVPGYQFGQGFGLGAAISVAFSLARYQRRNDAAGELELPALSDESIADEPAIGAFSGRVPISVLCDSRDASADLLSGGFVAAGGGAAFNSIHPMSEYRWDLPVPFYIPRGHLFIPQFYGLGGNVGPFGGSLSAVPPLQVQISYEGSLLDPDRYGDESDYTDDVIRIPFAASFLAPAAGTNSQSYVAQSDETNLVNVYDHEVKITQFNGKIVGVPEMTDVSIDVGAGLQVRLISGNNVPIVRDFSEWREIFDRQARAWSAAPFTPSDGAFRLRPGEFVLASLTGAKAATATNGSYQPMIAMTGYREILRSQFE